MILLHRHLVNPREIQCPRVFFTPELGGFELERVWIVKNACDE